MHAAQKKEKNKTKLTAQLQRQSFIFARQLFAQRSLHAA
jgi:hypothetical protein